MNGSEEIKSLKGWAFGDSGAMADHLGQLVLQGKKTATSSLLAFYQDDNEPLPKVGERSYIKDSQNNPLCIIEITEVTIQPFKEVDATFARDEGEGDLSLDYWRTGHREFFRKHYPHFHEAMDVVCERFKVIKRAPGR